MQEQSLFEKARTGRIIALNSLSGHTGDRTLRRKIARFQSVRMLSSRTNTDRLFGQFATLQAAA